MKHLFLNTLAAAAILALSAPLGLAQSTLSATVPFAFGVDGQTVLPAGTYTISRAGSLWQFQNREAKSAAFVTGSVTDSRISDPSRLVFECRADRCSLREIQAGYGWAGYHLPVRWDNADALKLARVVVVPLNRSEGE